VYGLRLGGINLSSTQNYKTCRLEGKSSKRKETMLVHKFFLREKGEGHNQFSTWLGSKVGKRKPNALSSARRNVIKSQEHELTVS